MRPVPGRIAVCKNMQKRTQPIPAAASTAPDVRRRAADARTTKDKLQ